MLTDRTNLGFPNPQKIKIRLNTEMPIQVDGEPWVQSACEVNILRSALKVSGLMNCWLQTSQTR